MNIDLIIAAVSATKMIDDLSQKVTHLESQLKSTLNRLDDQNEQLNQWERLGQNPSDVQEKLSGREGYWDALSLLEEVARTPTLTLRQTTMDSVRKFVNDNLPF